MYTSFVATALLSCFASTALSQSTTLPGYDSNVPSTTTNASLSFGQHYAVLNLDLIEGLVSGINTTAAGQAFITNTANWIDTVHQQTPPPLSIFTRIYFSNAQRPEIAPSDPFFQVAVSLGNATATSPQSQLYHAFSTIPADVVLRKSRYYAGDGNSLEEILSSQKIDTVILVGVQLKILATAEDADMMFAVRHPNFRRHPQHGVSPVRSQL